MLKLKFTSSIRKLDLPIYSLTEKKSRVKSTFIDHNRVDTVKPGIGMLTLEGFIKSGYFYEMVFEDCYEASKKDNKIVSLPCDSRDDIKLYLENFFVNNNLGVIVNKGDYDYHYSFEIKIKLNKNITFEAIDNAYTLEQEKIHLSNKNVKCKKLTPKKKINNDEN